MQFREIQYERPDVDAACQRIENMARRIVQAGSTSERLEILAEYEGFLAALTTTLAVGQLRYYLNTGNAAHAAEAEYLGANAPRLETAASEVMRALLEAPDRAGLEQTLGAFFFERAEAERRVTSPVNEALLVEEQALVQRYIVLTSQAVVEFEGKTRNLSAMPQFYGDPDRERRRGAMTAVNAWYEQSADELDEIFDALVKNRTEQARNLGFANYTDMRYATRFGYGRREIEALREEVTAKWVPLVCEIKERQRMRLGVDSFRMYDSPIRFQGGNPKLKVKRAAFVDAAQELFDRIGAGAGEYFRTLREGGMLDLFDRKGKVPYAGFCLNLPAHDMDFICARFTGDQSDFEILTHEFGHAYASHRAAEAGVRLSLRETPQEIAETHSKTMELLTMTHAGLFFEDEDARRYMVKQLEYIAYFITAVCAGDEFQHEIYDHPEMRAAERNAAYERIFRKYNPYMDLSDLPFASWGSQWQDTLVIYSMPFYFIDYALAQVLALELYAQSQKDPAAAWETYTKYLDISGTLSFPEAAHACGLQSPFKDGCMDSVREFLSGELHKLWT